MATNTTTGFRLSAEQERVCVQQGDTPFIAQSLALLEGPLRPEILKQALANIVQQQEILRTVYRRQAGLKLPFQVILDTCEPVWNAIDQTALDEAAQTAFLDGLMSSASSLNLEDGPLVHVSLAALSPQKHAFVLSVPALAADSRTLRNLLDEIGRNYAALVADQPIEAEAMQYVDIVQWQTDLLESEESKACRDYWRDYSRTIDLTTTNSIALPFESKSGAISSSSVYSIDLDSQRSQQLATITTGEPHALETFLLSCFATLIGRLTNQPSVVLGCTLDGRKYEELETALGLFARDLPLLINLQPDTPFSTLLRNTSVTVTDANQWQEGFSWAHFTESRDSTGPTLPLTFEYIDLGSEQTYDGLSFTTIQQRVPRQRAKLNLAAVQRPTGLTLEFHFDPTHLSRESTERIAGYFHTLMAAAIDQPDTLAGDLPLLGPAERDQVVIDWNRTAAPYPTASIQQLFEAQATATPDRPAVRCNDQVLTYAQLNEASNQLAHYLRSLGVGPDALVGLCIDRSTSMMVGILAILKAGGAYVPLNADNPKPRLAQQLGSATVLLTEQKLQPLMPEIAGTTLCIDSQQGLWSDQPRTDPPLQTTPENLAYILYTSGSTGVPKGVAVRHRNLVNYSHFIATRLQLDRHPEGLHFATVSTIAADLGNTCIYPALISGGCLHIIAYDVATDAQQLATYNAHHPIDVLKIVPSHLHALLQASQGAEILPAKYLITGGEALTPNLVREISQRCPHCVILNHYGPTETTVGSLTLLLSDFDWQHSTAPTIPIGKPIANTQTYILDARQQLLPPGVIGELYIAGDGVTAGYLNDPARTAERFLRNPFAADPAALMYRTGDTARQLPDGSIEFLGRSDDQVKIRGFRIELGEIEAVLATYPDVKQTVVLARENLDGAKHLLAYVVLPKGTTTTSEDLRTHLKQNLPDYMVPAAIILLPRLPLTPNGKIDRQALPEPELLEARQYIAPRTPTEEVVCAIWAEVLRTEKVSTEDSFFDLGGHSLLATQVISRIRRTLNVDLPLRSLFETPTVTAIAEQIDHARRDPAMVDVPPIAPVPRDQDLPLSFAQQRLWVLDQMEPNNPLYNIPRRTRLRGELNLPAFTAALNAIVARHESQRTTFAVKDGQPVQLIAPNLTLDVSLRDLSNLPEESKLSEAARMAEEEALIPFDLAAGPLVRATLVKLASEDHILLLTMHHIVSDAWSAGIFFKEFGELYNSHLSGQPSTLPELPVQYADYAAWQRNWYQGDVLDQQLAYWREHLRGAPPLLQLPTDRPRATAQSFQGFMEIISFSGETARALRKLGQQEGVTLFMSLLAGFQTLLSRYSGQDQIVIGTDVANRTTTETERLIGFFINLLALRTDLSGNRTYRDLLGRVREVALGAYSHQEMPFDKLVQELQPERSLSHNPIVQALFVMQNLPRQERNLSGLTLEPFELPVTRSKFDLAVFVVDQPDDLKTYWLYSTDLFDNATIHRMARHFESLLTNAVANPDLRLNAIPYLSDEEVQQQEEEKKQKKQSSLKKLLGAAPKGVHIQG